MLILSTEGILVSLGIANPIIVPIHKTTVGQTDRQTDGG